MRKSRKSTLFFGKNSLRSAVRTPICQIVPVSRAYPPPRITGKFRRPKIDRKSTENRSKIDRKSILVLEIDQNRPRIDRKSTENRPKIDRKSIDPFFPGNFFCNFHVCEPKKGGRSGGGWSGLPVGNGGSTISVRNLHKKGLSKCGRALKTACPRLWV